METLSIPQQAVDGLTENEIEILHSALLLTEFSQRTDNIICRIQESPYLDHLRSILLIPSESLLDWRMKKGRILSTIEKILRKK